MVLGRLATDKRHKKKGIATGLVKHAFSVTWECSKYAGVAALLVHVLSDRAKDFYINRGFQESPISDTTLMIPISSIQLALESNANPEL
jgi:GNAT superfamily N-acetyltransferase